MTGTVVAAIDVGAVRNIGYWRHSPRGGSGGRSLPELVSLVVADLDADRPVALGFEAPAFVPLPQSADDLNRQRIGDRGRPWCAGAGTGAFAMGAQQSAWVLRAIAHRVQSAPPVTFDPDVFSSAGGLLIWEAFVTGAAKDRLAADPHVDDARRAVDEFRLRFDAGALVSDIADTSVFNVVGAALLAAGLTSDVRLLSSPCIVVRVPDRPLPTDPGVM